MKDDYPKPINDALESLDKMKGRVLSMISDVMFAESVIERFKDWKGMGNWSVSASCEAGQMQDILIHVTADDFRELIHIRKFLRQNGFPAPKESEYAEIGRKSWAYERKDHEPFVLMAFTRYDDGATCKYVEVGVKEEKVYELQCNGQKIITN